MQLTPLRKLLIALAAAVCVVPALAIAALPAKSSRFSDCDVHNPCRIMFETSETGRRIKDLLMGNRCAKFPAEYSRRISVTDSGRFRKTDTA